MAIPGDVIFPRQGAQQGGLPPDLVMSANIDWAQPVAAIRAQIAQLPEADRAEALRQWAESYVATNRARGGAGQTIDDLVRATARGTLVGSWLDEANALTSAGLHRVTGGAAGAPYEESLAYQRATDRAIDTERPIAAGAAQVAGALAGGGAAYRVARAAGLPSLAGTTLPRAIGLGAAVGGTQAAIYGAGASEGDVWERAAAALRAAPVGVAVGALVPTVLRSGPLLPRMAAAATIGGATGAIYGGDGEWAALGAGAAGALPGAARAVGGAARAAYSYASPALARAAATLRDYQSRVRITSGQGPGTLNAGIPMPRVAMAPADGSGGPGGVVTPGTRAAAEQVVADQLVRSGVSGPQLRTLLDDPEFARFYSNSFGQDVRTLADLDPALQRLASSAGRQSPEAGTLMAAIMRARQTGLTPDNAADAATVGAAQIPTRAQMTRAGESGVETAGQFERLFDGLRRVLRLEDYTFHGHGRTGLMTEKQLVEQAERNAARFYRELYRAGRQVNIGADIEPALARWEARLANEADDMRAELQRLIRTFRGSTNIQRFDRNKRRALDDEIEKAMNAGDRYRAMRLTELKNDLVAAADSIQAGNLGALYSRAREMFSSPMEARDAFRAGFGLWDEGSESGVQVFQRLAGEGHAKLARLGFLTRFGLIGEKARSGADRLALFDSPRVRELLAHVIPRTETAAGNVKAGAVFGDSPQRFGRYLDAEGRMIQTRAEVVGNSKTAQRLADDEAYQSLSTIAEIWRASSNPITASAEIVSRLAERLFGMGADVSAEIARMLFTADPVQRARNLQAIVARMGADRAAQLARYMERIQAGAAGAAARGVASQTQGQ